MRSNELNNYFKTIVPALKQRKYDKAWLVWFPHLTFADDGAWSVAWEIRGVFKDYDSASKAFKTLTA